MEGGAISIDNGLLGFLWKAKKHINTIIEQQGFDRPPFYLLNAIIKYKALINISCIQRTVNKIFIGYCSLEFSWITSPSIPDCQTDGIVNYLDSELSQCGVNETGMSTLCGGDRVRCRLQSQATQVVSPRASRPGETTRRHSQNRSCKHACAIFVWPSLHGLKWPKWNCVMYSTYVQIIILIWAAVY